jgi:hypothetical protein
MPHLKIKDEPVSAKIVPPGVKNARNPEGIPASFPCPAQF